MKSYLRHSKDRRVRGSANGASTVSSLLGTKKEGKKGKKNLSTNRHFEKKKLPLKLYRGGKKKKFSLSLPPEQNLQDTVLFALMIRDGAGLLALIVAAGLSILYRGK